MNKIYRLFWNAVTQQWVAVAENALSRGKGSADSVTASAPAALQLRTCVGVVCAALYSLWFLQAGAHAQTAPTANHLPSGGRVVSGQASIDLSGATMNVNQGSQRAAIDWQNFNVGSAATVNFIQPNSNSVALNRVLDGNASQIFGKLNANGQVFLSNANGVYFATGATANVGGLVATTHSISNADFMAGSNTLARNGAAGSVINEGTLQARLGGYIALLAPKVRNQGLIIAQQGTVALASGEVIDLQFDAQGGMSGLRVSPMALRAVVENRSAVQAPGGLIILSAHALNQLQASVVNSGSLSANSMVTKGGRIILESSGLIDNSGTITANAGNGGPAGSISLSAPDVRNSGTISATGTADSSGGQLLVSAGNFIQSPLGQLDSSADSQGGQVQVDASGSVQLAGSILVSGRANADANGTISQGGDITVLAAQITVENAQLDASGDRGGLVRMDTSAAANTLSAPSTPSTPLPVSERGKVALFGTTQISVRGHRSRGGGIQLLGDDLHLNDRAQINATGEAGGGTVLVGGGWQGSGGYHQATTVTMGESASIDVSATKVGDGGTAVLWSDVNKDKSVTAAYGTILGRGGYEGGNGGRIETSGHQINIDGVSVNAGTADTINGKAGLWLIDPFDYTITTAGAATISGALNSSDVTVTTTANNASYGATGVGTGHITFNNAVAIAKTAAGTTTLTLQADGRIIGSNYSITSSSGALHTVLWANHGGASNGVHTGTITTKGGHVWIGGGTDSIKWNGLTVGNGPALGNVGGNYNSIDMYGAINTTDGSGGGGDVYVWSGTPGPGLSIAGHSGAPSINAGSGNVTVRGNTFIWAAPFGITTTGAFTFWSGTGTQTTDTGSLGQATDLDFFQFNAAPSSLTWGGSSNTQDVSLTGTYNPTLSVAGPIGIYGGSINIAANLTSTLSGAAILAKSTGNITHAANVVVKANAGNVTYWADSDNSGNGGILVNNGGQIDTRTAADRLTATLAGSAGGRITLAGGLDDGSNGGTATDGRPDGYAANGGRVGNFETGVLLGTSVGTNILLYSGGGDITLRGKTTLAGSNGAAAVQAYQGYTIDAGQTGNITMFGASAISGAVTSAGFDLAAFRVNGNHNAQSSIRTRAGNIAIIGMASGGTRENLGVSIDGDSIDRVALEASAGGSITVTGTATGTGMAIRTQGADYLANTGAISLIGSAGNITSNTVGITVGKKVGSAVTSSTSNVLLRADSLNISSTSTVDATGTLTIEPYTVGTTIGLAGGAGTLSLADSLFSGSSRVFQDGFSSITIGNASAGNVTLDGALVLTDSANVVTGGNLTINAASSISSSQAAGTLTLAATGNFINNRGSTAVQTTDAGESDRWIVYSAQPSLNTFGSLNSTNKAIWGQTYASLAPAGVAAGNRYVFANASDAAVTATTSTNATKVYGQMADLSGIAIVYTGTSLSSAATFGNLYLNNVIGDVLSTLPTVGSAGALSTADVSGSPYAITSSGGVVNSGYSITYSSNGTLTITPKALTMGGLTVPTSKIYDATTAAVVGGIAALTGTQAFGVGSAVDGLAYSGDAVSLTGTAVGTYNSKDVASATTASFSGLSLAGAKAGNYSLTVQSPASATITPKALTQSGLSVATSKVYDGSTNATVIGSSALQAAQAPGAGSTADGKRYTGDTVSLTGTAVASYNDKDVLDATTVSFSGLSLTGAQASNYSLTSHGTSAATITAKALTASVSAPNKIYDGHTTTTPTLSITAGLVGSETVDASGTATFNSKDVLSANLVTVNSTTLADGTNGGLASNYSLDSGQTVIAYITPKSVTVSGFAANNKVYDGTTGATISNYGAVNTGIGSETLLLDHNGAAFNDANAGNDKTVTVSSYVLQNGSNGGLASNYALTSTNATTTANITAATLTVTANNDAKFVTQADTGGFNGASYIGFVGGDTSTALGGTLSISRSNSGVNGAGSYSGVLVPSGLTSSNYNISFANGNYTIMPASQLLVKVNNLSTVYGTTPTYVISTAQYLDGSNVIQTLAAPTVVGNNYSYGDGAGGTTVFTLSALSAPTSTAGKITVGNYAIGSTDITETSVNFSNNIVFVGNHVVTQAPVTANAASGVSKVYDGSAAMNGVNITLSGTLGGDSVSASGSGAYATENAGSQLRYTVSGVTLGGADAANYTVSGGTSFNGANGSITPKALTMGGLTVPTSKIYDATTAAVVGGIAALTGTQAFGVGSAVDGLAYSGDAVSLTGTAVGTYNSKDVASATTASFSGLSLAGAKAGNYSLTVQSPASATITPKALTQSGLSVATSKVYDGSTNATVIGSSALQAAQAPGAGSTADGKRYTGDTVSLTGTAVASYNDKDVLDATTVSFSGLSLTGAQASNYSLTSHGTSAATITAKALTASVSAPNKIYDGHTTTTPTLSITAGLVGSETVDASGTATFNSKDVLSANLVTVNSTTLADGTNGGLASNYSLDSGQTVIAYITPKSVTVSGFAANNKVYDGTTGATISNYGAVNTGIGSETLLLDHNGAAFNDANAGNDKTVTVSSYVLQNGSNGGLASNYALTSTNATTTANITAATLTVTANNDAKFVTQADTGGFNGASYIGFVGGDTSTALGGTLSISRSNSGVNGAGSYSGVLVPSGLTSSNYNISFANGNYTIMPASQLLVKVNNLSTVYGTTPTYVISTAQYLDGSNVIQTLAAPTVVGNNYSYGDGAGGTTVFTLSALSAPTSTAGKITVGNYAIGSTDITETSVNFSNNIVFVGNHVVTQAPVTANAASGVSKVYDGSAAMNGVNITLSGTLGGDSVSASGSGAYATENAGSQLRYTVSGVTLGGADAANYTVSGGTITGTDGSITKANLSVTANDQSKNYNSQPYSGGNGVVYSGFINGETAAVLNGSLSYGGNSQGALGPGNYAIIPAGLSASNYQLSYVSGTLAVIALPPVLPINPPPLKAPTDPSDPMSPPKGGGLVDGGDTTPTTPTAPTDGVGATTTAPTNGGDTTPTTSTNPTNGGGATTTTPTTLKTATAPIVQISGGRNLNINGNNTAQTKGSSSGTGGLESNINIAITMNKLASATETGVITLQVPKDMATSGKGFSVALPQQLLENMTANDKVEVTMQDGSPLLSWLRFDPETQSVVASAVPNGALPAQLLVRIGQRSSLMVISVRVD